MKALFASIFFSIITTSLAQAHLIENVAFLKGCWGATDGSGSKITETWLPNSIDTMLGVGQTVNQSGQTVRYEFMSIALNDLQKSLIFSPIIDGYPGAKFTYDENLSTKSKAIFVNLKNDFPSKIFYSVTTTDQLDIRLEGTENGHAAEWEYSLIKEECKF